MMLPHERSMVAHMKGKPFTLLGINSDQSRSALKKIMKDEKITWPNIYDGMPGKIASHWNVHGWPTIYVIDAKGIIAARDLRDDALEAEVKKLVATIPSTGPAASQKSHEPKHDDDE